MITLGYVVFVGTVICVALSAPMEQTKLEDIKAALRAQISDQEKALESLATVPEKEPTSAEGLGVLYKQSHSFANVDGATEEHESHEQTVSDVNDNVLSDVSEHVDRKQPTPDSEPSDSFRANVDIPSQGVHQEISDINESLDSEGTPADTDEDEFQTPDDLKNTIEFTPEEMAKYLLATGETAEFKAVLNDLVDSSKITPEQAEQYEKDVFDEYFKLAQEDTLPGNSDTYPEAEAMYPQYMDSVYPQQPLYPAYNGVPFQQEQEEVLPLYSAGPAQSPDESNMNSYINYLLNRPVTLDEMISTLLEEWLTRAVVTGDPEALAIMGNIVDYVSTDDNPNDEEQVREILGDIFADALLEDLTPRVGPQLVPEMPESELPTESEAAAETVEDEKTETPDEQQTDQVENSQSNDVEAEGREQKMQM